MDERTKQDVEYVGCEDETQTPLQTETFARKHLHTHTQTRSLLHMDAVNSYCIYPDRSGSVKRPDKFQEATIPFN